MAHKAIVVGHLSLSEIETVEYIGPLCEGCPFAGQVTAMAPETAVVEHVSWPYGGKYADVLFHFEQPGDESDQSVRKTGLVGVRVYETDTNEAAARQATVQVTEALRKCVDNKEGPLIGRDSGLVVGFVMRKTVRACGAFHQLRRTSRGTPVIEVRPILTITDAPV